MSLRLLIGAFACAILGAVMDADAQGAARKRVGVILNSVPISQLQPGALTSPIALAIQGEIVKAGWHPGRNLDILWRSAEDDFSRFPALVDELLRQGIDVFVVGHNSLAQLVRKKAPTTPIVMCSGDDLVKEGVVASYARPGGNITGIELTPSTELYMKRLSLLREAVPRMTRLAYLGQVRKRTREWGSVIELPGKRDPAWETSPHRDVVVLLYGLENLNEIEEAVAHAARAKVQAVMIDGCPACFQAHVQARIHTALEKHRLPAMSSFLDAVAVGWMTGYGTEPNLNFRRAGHYVGRILNGAHAAELPVERLGDFKLHINRRTARDFGLSLPAALLLRADKVYD